MPTTKESKDQTKSSDENKIKKDKSTDKVDVSTSETKTITKKQSSNKPKAPKLTKEQIEADEKFRKEVEEHANKKSKVIVAIFASIGSIVVAFFAVWIISIFLRNDTDDSNALSRNDIDGDGLTNDEETSYGTNPNLEDTDYDGLDDKEEVRAYFTNPLVKDTDGDLLTDFTEVKHNEWKSGPANSAYCVVNGCPDFNPLIVQDYSSFDLDKDTILDKDEQNGYSITIESNTKIVYPSLYDIDSDRDGLDDLEEYNLGIDATSKDTDKDYIEDNLEIEGWENKKPGNGQATIFYSDATMMDSDKDGATDYTEKGGWRTTIVTETGSDSTTAYSDPLKKDEDNDGLNDLSEQKFKTLPYASDSDEDGYDDKEEVEQIINGQSYDVNATSWDSDNDGLSDKEEIETHHTNPGNADEDEDGLTDIEEIENGTSSSKSDSDNDGLDDLVEINGWKISVTTWSETTGQVMGRPFSVYSDPNNSDSDGDSLSDNEEYQLGTNPTNSDTDSDQLFDDEEIYGEFLSKGFITNPNSGDSDLDNLGDLYEVTNSGLNPNSVDSDNDDAYDGNEIVGKPIHVVKLTGPNTFTSTDYVAKSVNGDDDSDDDGLDDGLEYSINSDPNLSDTDFDGMSDFAEYNSTTKTSPSSADTDNDKLSDDFEISLGTDPLLSDTDGDTMDDGYEFNNDHEPLNNDEDEDGAPDGNEILGVKKTLTIADQSNINPITGPEIKVVEESFVSVVGDTDTDNDGVSDGDEYTNGTNPSGSDTDKDTILDVNESLVLGSPGDGYSYLKMTLAVTADTDRDGLSDAFEIGYANPFYNSSANEGSNNPKSFLPNDKDTDRDGILDGQELELGLTNPFISDVDGDNANDGTELYSSTEYYITTLDPNGDGKIDNPTAGTDFVRYTTMTYKSDPNVPDTDGDTLVDGYELNGGITSNPELKDTDGDGLDDNEENQTLIISYYDANGNLINNPNISEPSSIYSRPDMYDADDYRYAISIDQIWSDEKELQMGTNPILYDTDRDGFGDPVDSNPLDARVH